MRPAGALMALALIGATPVPPSEKTPAAAVALLRRYYAAVNAHDWTTAHRIWSGGRSVAALRRGYADTAATRMRVAGTPAGDAGAGNLYLTVPVVVEARLKDGRRQRFAGSYVLHRVNDVDGAGAAQLRWSVRSATLKETPAGG